MNAVLQTIEPAAPLRSLSPVPLLRTLVLCDLADSTALVERLGDRRAAELFRKHDRLARSLVHQYGGQEIDKTDGFLMMFERPIQAVAFALAYQRGLRQLDDTGNGVRLLARVGIHVGDVVAWDNTPDDVAKGAKPVEVEGLVKPITSRLMTLALPGQILLSGVAFQLAHRAQGELGDQVATALWRTHGRYRFKGLPDPIAVFEVGEQGLAPLKAPPWSGKAHREVPFWRRPATMAIEILMALALVAIPAWYLFRPEPAIAFAKRDWIVVGDLKNLTGETSFDDSLETAFRISLEQSRHVNVLSDLSMRETVRLMQSDPEKTKIDRTVGSEIAVRDGARALILPTVAEIGGRVRVTAEVVDPHTRTTVWSESADGKGTASVFTSIDEINRKLRVRLGEALATVSHESKPLEKVATNNLDALTAYSLAQRAYDIGNDKDALELYKHAIKLDPEFATAHIGLARVLLVTDQRAAAISELDKLSAASDRLSARDSLLAEAWKLSLSGSNQDALAKWRLVTQLYPDFLSGQGLFAFFAWEFANRFDNEVVDAAKASSSPRNSNAATSLLLLGMLHLGNERYDDAAAAFAAAEKSGMSWHFDYALPSAAQRRFDAADAVLVRGNSADTVSPGIDAYAQRVAMQIDRGAFDGGRKDLAAALSDARKESPEYVRLFAGMELALANVLEDFRKETRPSALPDYVESTRNALKKATSADKPEIEFELLLAAYTAARHGDIKLAQSAIDTLGKGPFDSSLPVAKMLLLAKAEVARVGGRPADAINALKSAFDGTEFFLAHVSLMEAYAANHDTGLALDEARWLAKHRGRAYAEYSLRQALVPLNVAESNLALLRTAELLHASGDDTGARSALNDFLRNWPKAKNDATLASRINALQASR